MIRNIMMILPLTVGEDKLSQFQVSQNNSFGMAVLDCDNHLSKKIGGFGLREASL